MKGISRVWIGLIFIVIGIALLIGGNQSLIYFLDNSQTIRDIPLASNVGYGESLYNLTFNFTKNSVYSNYDISNGKRLYTSYLNVYSTELLDNSSIENIMSIQLNNNVYVPSVKKYEYSLTIDDGTLNEDIQRLSINKTSNLTIDKITLNYRGIDYQNMDYLTFASFIITAMVFFIGIGFLVKR